MLSHTGFLAFRVWKVCKETALYKRVSPAARTVFESGAIYSMTITAALISFVVKSNGVYVLLDMVCLSIHIFARTRRARS